jgi:putative membrane protein
MRNLESPMMKVAYLAGVTTFCTFLGCWAVLAHQEETQKPARATVSDAQFARKAAQGSMAEMKLGQLARNKGTADSLKKFGERMMEDHSKAWDELKHAAEHENIVLPRGMSAKDQSTYEALSKLSGAAFDRAYARDMVNDHEEDIAEFNKEANGGHNPTIKDFAVQTLPTLEDHLKQAKEMRQNVAASTRTSTKGNSTGHPGRT